MYIIFVRSGVVASNILSPHTVPCGVSRYSLIPTAGLKALFNYHNGSIATETTTAYALIREVSVKTYHCLRFNWRGFEGGTPLLLTSKYVCILISLRDLVS